MRRILVALVCAVAILSAPFALAGGYTVKYEVMISNLTPGQTFTPLLVTTHDRRIALFEPGSPASDALEILAEAGDTSPLTQVLLEQPYNIADVQSIPGLLGPGERTSVIVEADRFHPYLSIAAMLIPTNDTFVALNSVRLPWNSSSYTAIAYDAGTEANDQNCLRMPGPRCGGEGFSPGPNEGDEGFVYVSNGFHSLPPAQDGEVLGPAIYDWRNPVAEIVVRRLR